MPEYRGTDQKGCLEFATSMHRRVLLAVAYNVCRQAELARDAVQQSFLVLAQRDCCTVDNLRAFLMTIIRRYLMRTLRDPRKAAARESFPEMVPDEDGEASDTAMLERPVLLALLATLPENQKRLLELVYFEGYKPGEAAGIMEIQPAQAHQLHFAALRMLRSKLEKDRRVLE